MRPGKLDSLFKFSVAPLTAEGHRPMFWDRNSGTGRHLLDFSLSSSQFLIFCPKK